jgi:hypothetical protein
MGMLMKMSATNASNCAKNKKKRLAHKLSSKIQKEVQKIILAPAFDEVGQRAAFIRMVLALAVTDELKSFQTLAVNTFGKRDWSSNFP